jgi:hypothetical protein
MGSGVDLMAGALAHHSHNSFRTMIEHAARELVTVAHDRRGAFLKMPLIYPSGAGVVVRVEPAGDQYFVSDMGTGHEEADLMGGSFIYNHVARPIAEQAGVGFDQYAFFVLKAGFDQLPGAVATIANCAHEAVIATSYRLAEKKFDESEERLYERLAHIFTPKLVQKAPMFLGASTTAWRLTALVRSPGRQSLFEIVSKHPTSIATAATKFHDIARLESPPIRVAVVKKKELFGTYLGVLSQAANVVEEDISDAAIKRLANAA